MKQKPRPPDSGYLSGMVRCCECGSTAVRGHNRYGIKSQKVTAVEYVCDCGNRYINGKSELSVPSCDPERLRRLGFQVGGR
jgi:hypothetical protein